MAGLPLFNPFPIPLKFQLVSEDIPIPTHNRARFTGINIYAGKNRRHKEWFEGGERREKSNIRVNVVLNGYLGVREKFKLKNLPSFYSCVERDHAVFARDQWSVATLSPFVFTTRGGGGTERDGCRLLRIPSSWNMKCERPNGFVSPRWSTV